jgi:hypothetical protein
MSSWEPQQGETDEWYTPKYIFDAFGVPFDLDPFSPGAGKCHTPALIHFQERGLERDWNVPHERPFVWMNPPFGGRNGVVPCIEKFIENGNGIGLCRAYTSAGWFQDLIPKMDAILFPRGKTQFERPDGTVGKSPGSGVCFYALGDIGVAALKECGLGFYLEVK